MNKTDRSLLDRRYAVLGRHFPLFYDTPLHPVKGEGVWLYDAEGRSYLDVYNNVAHVGHCHPHVVDAICRQAATLNTHTRYLHENILDYAERLTATFESSLAMAMFTCTGSEANELALRMARHCTSGVGVIVTDNAYHGNTEAVAELGTAFMPESRDSRRVRSIPVPDSYRPPFDLQGNKLTNAYVEEVRKAIEGFAADGIPFAGMVLCPDLANEGLVDVPPEFMKQAVDLVHEAGGLFIADEIQAGFGRSGQHMWAYQSYNVLPDIVTLGKPMGNGHPIAGLVAKPHLVEDFTASAMYFNTFGGNPVSCAAAMAVLDVLEQEQLLQNAVDTGAYTLAGLKKLQEKYELIGDVRSLGLFFAVELVREREAKTPATDEARRIVDAMRERGILLSKIGRYDNILKMRPPMPFYEEHADILLSTLDEVLSTL
jgi:4-aminobutyrate aminotransferase-like enzyme